MNKLSRESFIVDRGEGDCSLDYYDAEQVDDVIAALQAKLEASEKAAYDVAGTIEALKAELEEMTTKRENLALRLMEQEESCASLLECIEGKEGWREQLETVKRLGQQYVDKLAAQVEAETWEKAASLTYRTVSRAQTMVSTALLSDLESQFRQQAQRAKEGKG